MCLTITVEVAELDSDQLRNLARAVSDADLEFVAQGPGLLRRHTPRLALHGCDLLSDDADWHASTWAMTDDAARRLAASFARMFELVAAEIRLAAIWEGDRAETDEPIIRSEFLRRISASGLGTKTRYVVPG